MILIVDLVDFCAALNMRPKEMSMQVRWIGSSQSGTFLKRMNALSNLVDSGQGYTLSSDLVKCCKTDQTVLHNTNGSRMWITVHSLIIQNNIHGKIVSIIITTLYANFAPCLDSNLVCLICLLWFH